MNADEMAVNGKKLPDDVLKKYKEKYPRFAKAICLLAMVGKAITMVEHPLEFG